MFTVIALLCAGFFLAFWINFSGYRDGYSWWLLSDMLPAAGALGSICAVWGFVKLWGLIGFISVHATSWAMFLKVSVLLGSILSLYITWCFGGFLARKRNGQDDAGKSIGRVPVLEEAEVMEAVHK